MYIYRYIVHYVYIQVYSTLCIYTGIEYIIYVYIYIQVWSTLFA